MVRIIWHGHACFEIVGENVNIVIDPHDGSSIGMPPPKAKGDIILVTHDHFDHNAVNVVKKPDSIVIDSIVEKEIKGVKISTVEDYHDPQMGRQRGRVRIYKLTIEDTTIVHVGDLGRIPDEDKINWMKNVDIFLVPVGGTFTLGGSEAATLVKKVTPKVTIPMHYKVPGSRLPISGVDSFLKHFSDIEQVDSNIYEVIKPLPEGKIVVLKPPR